MPHPDCLLAILLFAIPSLRGVGAIVWTTLRSEQLGMRGLAISAHWRPPCWDDALVACGLNAAVGLHQRRAMRHVALTLTTWHLLMPSIYLFARHLFSDELRPEYRLAAYCLSVRASLYLGTTCLLLLWRPSFFLADLSHTWSRGAARKAVPVGNACTTALGGAHAVISPPVEAEESDRLWKVLFYLLHPELFALLALSHAFELPLSKRDWNAAIRARRARAEAAVCDNCHDKVAGVGLAIRLPGPGKEDATVRTAHYLSCYRAMFHVFPVFCLPLALVLLISTDLVAMYTTANVLWRGVGGSDFCATHVVRRFTSELASPYFCSDECPLSDDGECDDGGPGAEFAYGSCALGSDCTDCGLRVQPNRIGSFPLPISDPIHDASIHRVEVSDYVNTERFQGAFAVLSRSQQLEILAMVGGTAVHAQPVDPSDPMLTQRGDLEGVSAFMRPPGRLIVAYPGCTDAALCYSCGKGCGTMALGDVLIPSCIKGTGRLVPAAGDIVTDLTLSRAFASLTNECTIVPPSLLRDAMANLACAEVAPPPSLLAALTLAVFGPVLLVWRAGSRARCWQRCLHIGYLCTFCCCLCCFCEQPLVRCAKRVARGVGHILDGCARETVDMARCCRLCCLPGEPRVVQIGQIASTALEAIDAAAIHLQISIGHARALQADPVAERRTWELAAVVFAAAPPDQGFSPRRSKSTDRRDVAQSRMGGGRSRHTTEAARERAEDLQAALSLLEGEGMSTAVSGWRVAVAAKVELEAVRAACENTCRSHGEGADAVDSRAGAVWHAAKAVQAVAATKPSRHESDVRAVAAAVHMLRVALKATPTRLTKFGD